MDIKIFYTLRDPQCKQFMSDFKDKVLPKINKYSVTGVSTINIDSLNDAEIRSLSKIINRGLFPFIFVDFNGSREVYSAKNQILDILYIKIKNAKEKKQRVDTNNKGVDNRNRLGSDETVYDSFNMLEYGKPTDKKPGALNVKESMIGEQSGGLGVYTEEQFKKYDQQGPSKLLPSVSRGLGQIDPNSDGAIDPIEAKFANDSYEVSDFDVRSNYGELDKYDSEIRTENDFVIRR